MDAALRGYRSGDRMWEALARGELSIDDTVAVGTHRDTVGRCLVARCLPPSFAASRVWESGYAERVIRRLNATHGAEVTARCMEALERLGCWVLVREAPSLGLDDFAPLPDRAQRLAASTRDAVAVEQSYFDGQITEGERYNKVVDIWTAAADRERRDALDTSPSDGALATLTQRGAAIADLRAMAPLVARSSGEIVERPIRSTLAEGRPPHEAFIRWRALRSEVVKEDFAPFAIAAFLHDLHVALAELRVSSIDCGTTRGVELGPVRRNDGSIAVLAGARAVGRVLVDDAIARDGTAVARAGACVGPDVGDRIDAAHLPTVCVRDPLTCDADDGPCARCVGLDPADGSWMQPGDAIGARVAYALARACLLHRAKPFHIC